MRPGVKRPLPSGGSRRFGSASGQAPLELGLVPLEPRKPLEPPRQVPVPVAEQLHRRRQQHARTIVASIRIAAASPTPNCLKNSIESVPKTAKTQTMTIAALVTTPAVDLIPCAIASSVLARGRTPRGSG